MSHSKRNTARSIFTAHERAVAHAHWNTSTSARLTRDSFLPFGSCSLCLELARDPVACSRGDVFCRECALANILAQKKELKRAEKARAEQEEEDKRRAELMEEEEKERAVRDFERTQAGLSVQGQVKAPVEVPTTTIPTSKIKTIEWKPENESHFTKKLEGDAESTSGAKRKFALDNEDVERTAKQDRAKARKAINDEKASKPSLPSFWTPSLTPDIRDSKVSPANKKHKSTPTCPSSQTDNPHPLSMQKLITIKFEELMDDSTKDKRRSCPSCRKGLTNASAPIMAKHCGHVLCDRCVQTFLIPPKGKPVKEEDSVVACFVCDEPVAVLATGDEAGKDGLPTGLVALRSEGTGFSAKGASNVRKAGVAFQA
ncbi:Nitric oxide synthase-interacting protein-like protein [Emericellopsis cladophorae]|uniref:Nitric oxide synthase-interacting protein-like protein n=1 Tax=Emericellopsis cladophorae TaxID=2686198 RepID=A0A9P9XX78_9HYPO|nr:Nitric oxide synthase-interacting protein-like protein [Emericellopsis cladophorae]KAI6779517.1 Nitric oxide synthase-interacting protein-like protein [Emericellopsis cladophorae]